MAKFEDTEYDLNTQEGRKAYLRAYHEWLRKQGYRVDDLYEKDEAGNLTLLGLAQKTDTFAHNMSIRLREAADKLGRDTEGGKLVGEMWHDLMANASSTYLTARRFAEEGKHGKA